MDLIYRSAKPADTRAILGLIGHYASQGQMLPRSYAQVMERIRDYLGTRIPIVMQDIYRYDKEGVDGEHSRAYGKFIATGVHPTSMSQSEAAIVAARGNSATRDDRGLKLD